MTKRLTALILTAICLLLLTPNIVYAINSEPSNLTVNMSYDDAPLEGINVAICLVADARANGGSWDFDVVSAFAGTETDFSRLTTAQNIALAASLDSYASEHDIERVSDITDKNGNAVFSDLSAGLYLVAQIDSENSDYSIAPYIVMVPTPDPINRGVWDRNVVSYPKTEPRLIAPDFISVSVYKIWKGTDNPPESIQAQLYQDGSPYGEAVLLSAANLWTHTWINLDSDFTWTVDESAVPNGYTKAVSGNATNGFIITNTKAPDKPPFDVPKTDDTSNIELWFILLITASIGLFVVLCVLNSKRLARIFTRK